MDIVANVQQELLDSLAATLRQALDGECYADAPVDPSNGNLPLSIAYVRVEPWLFGDEHVTLRGAWELACETALQWERCPVLAVPAGGGWVFRVPLHFVDQSVLGRLAEDQDLLDFDLSVVLQARGFGLCLKHFQEARERAEDALAMVGEAIGIERLLGDVD